MSLAIRSILVASAVSFVALSSASANEKVTFGTNWLAEAEHGGYYQSVADGTYAACGLDVKIVPGGPQVNNRPLLMAGKIEFNMGGNMLLGLPGRRSRASRCGSRRIFQKDPQILMSHPGQGLETWNDLKKADKLFIGNNGFQTFYQWMITEYGFEGRSACPTPSIRGPSSPTNSAQQGYVTSEPFAVEKQGGFKPNVFLLADNGCTPTATTIEAMQKTIDKHPDWVKCFVDGSAKGWYNYLYGDNRPRPTS